MLMSDVGELPPLGSDFSFFGKWFVNYPSKHPYDVQYGTLFCKNGYYILKLIRLYDPKVDSVRPTGIDPSVGIETPTMFGVGYFDKCNGVHRVSLYNLIRHRHQDGHNHNQLWRTQTTYYVHYAIIGGYYDIKSCPSRQYSLKYKAMWGPSIKSPSIDISKLGRMPSATKHISIHGELQLLITSGHSNHVSINHEERNQIVKDQFGVTYTFKYTKPITILEHINDQDILTGFLTFVHNKNIQIKSQTFNVLEQDNQYYRMNHPSKTLSKTNNNSELFYYHYLQDDIDVILQTWFQMWHANNILKNFINVLYTREFSEQSFTAYFSILTKLCDIKDFDYGNAFKNITKLTEQLPDNIKKQFDGEILSKIVDTRNYHVHGYDYNANMKKYPKAVTNSREFMKISKMLQDMTHMHIAHFIGIKKEIIAEAWNTYTKTASQSNY